MRIWMPDYGVGNLHSIRKALEKSGVQVVTVTDMRDLLDAKCIVFPGVGAFDKTLERLQPYRERIEERLDAGVPVLGICIGTQLMFESSAEGETPGLGFFKGRVEPLKAKTVPHMGWNTVETKDPLMEGIDDRFFYFAHSYYCDADAADIVGTTEYDGVRFPSFFRRKNVYGTQFHPEKSGMSGMDLIDNFINMAEDLI